MLVLLMVATIVVCPLAQGLYHMPDVSKMADAIGIAGAFIFTVFALLMPLAQTAKPIQHKFIRQA